MRTCGFVCNRSHVLVCLRHRPRVVFLSSLLPLCLSLLVVSLPLATPGVPGMLGGMAMGSGDKTMRELFVGNTPQGTSDFVLLEFLNAAMKQVSLP